MQRSFIATLAIASITVFSSCSSPEARSTEEYKRNLELVKAARANGYTVVSRGDKVLFCRKTIPTGSNVPRGECHSSEEWDAMQRHAEDAIEQDRVPFVPPPGVR